MRDVERTTQRLHELKGLSIQLAIDDFGTGYSSLAYLRQLPDQRLKIDKSFVGRLGTDPHDDAIVRSIVTLAHESRDAKWWPRAIETAEQLAALRALGCELRPGLPFRAPAPERPG